MIKFCIFLNLMSLCVTLVMCNSCRFSVHPIAPDKLSYGYTPYWDGKSNSLYFVDFEGTTRLFYRYDYRLNRLYSATLDSGAITTTFLFPLAGCNNEFAVSDNKRIVVIRWDGVSPIATTVRNMTAIEQDAIYANNAFDSGGIDPKGRLMAGTYRTSGCVQNSQPNATVYLFGKNREILPMITNVGNTAGVAWNKKKNLFYFVRLCTYTIYEYKWDPTTGIISDPRVVYTFPATKTYVLLGMTIDCEGKLYVGMYTGSQVIKINPKTNSIEDVIRLPVASITGLTFGGPQMDTLFVTTSSLTYFSYFDNSLPIDTPSNNAMDGQVVMVKGLCAKGCRGKRLKVLL